jgi:hypothetical protein
MVMEVMVMVMTMRVMLVVRRPTVLVYVFEEFIMIAVGNSAWS